MFLALTQSTPVLTDSEGKIPSVDVLAYTGGLVSLDAVPLPVVFDLASTSIAPNVTMLYGHDKNKPIGHFDKVVLTQNPPEIKASGKLSIDNDKSQEVRKSAKNGFPWQASVGILSEEVQEIRAGVDVVVNGQKFTGPIFVARNNILREVSILAVGADPNTIVNLNANLGVMMKFADWLKSIGTALGIDVATIPEEHTTALKGIFDDMNKAGTPTAEQQTAGNLAASITLKTLTASFRRNPVQTPVPAPTPTPTDDPITRQRQAFAAEARRIDSINAFARQYNNPQLNGVSLAASAIEQGWDVTRTELEMLRVSRPQNININTNNANSNVNPYRVMSAAIAQGIRKNRRDDTQLAREYTSQELDAAHKQYRGNVSLQQLLFEAASLNGYRGGWNVKTNLREVLQAAFSTMDISGIFSDSANKALMDGFKSVDETWRLISKISRANDFKVFTNYRGTGGFTFEKIAKNQFIPHGKMLEESFTNQVDTYANMFAINRQDMINDDLGVFDDVPFLIGRGGGVKFNKVFWTEYLDNTGSFFVAGNNNVSTGALAIAGLNSANVVFMQLKDANGDYILTQAKYLLVPPALLATAMQLYQSTDTVSGSTTALPSKNPFAGRFQPISSPYMQDSTITGNSSTAYYLLSDPASVPVIDSAFLFGNETPTVETADVDFNLLGIQMRGYFDFGVNLCDPKAGVRSTGA